MAKLVLFMGVTLDGYVAGPNGEHDWGQPPEDEELVEEVAALKGASGGELMAHGGASFARSLIRERLVDEYRLALHPLARGSGLSLWPETAEPLRLELAHVRRFDCGRILHTYRNASRAG